MRKSIAILTFLLLTNLSTGLVSAQERAPRTNEQQKEFLAHRLKSGAITGTFGAFGSLLFAALDIAIHTDDKEIGGTRLQSQFPDFYKPTTKEMFDAIALQTRSSWSYDAKSGYWVFAKPANPKPFQITIADKWTADDRGLYVGYKPPTFPVGMDVYYLGAYSSGGTEQQSTLGVKIRNSLAISFAAHFKKDVKLAAMRNVIVDGAEALYFETPTPRPGLVWRQWALVKNGLAFMIVSTLPDNNQLLLADVESMVKSFRVE